jgi:hypothetical protein
VRLSVKTLLNAEGLMNSNAKYAMGSRKGPPRITPCDLCGNFAAFAFQSFLSSAAGCVLTQALKDQAKLNQRTATRRRNAGRVFIGV